MNKISLFRKANRYTLKGMADKIGVSNSCYEKVEYEIRKPGRAFIEKFKSAFPDADIIELFFKTV